MPWNNQSGGTDGDGQGPRGPWSRGPSGSGPPDFQELMRRTHERLRQILVPGVKITPRMVAGAALALFAVWLLSGIYFVTSHEQGFVMRFGKVVRSSAQGINYHLPRPLETAEIVEMGNVKELKIGTQPGSDSGEQIDVPAESLMLTGDGNIVDINFTVQWDVTDASAYLFNVDTPMDKTIKAVAESAMREVIGQTAYDTINPSRATIEARVRDIIQKTLDLYGAGVGVTEVHLGAASAPEQVSKAELDVQAARTDQDAMRADAEAYANRQILNARGEAAGLVQQAEAYRQKVIAEAGGEANRFLAVYAEYKKAPEVTRRRMYLETMAQILGPMNKVIIDEPAGRNVLPYLALPDLQKKQNETVTVTPPQQSAGPLR